MSCQLPQTYKITSWVLLINFPEWLRVLRPQLLVHAWTLGYAWSIASTW